MIATQRRRLRERDGGGSSSSSRIRIEHSAPGMNIIITPSGVTRERRNHVRRNHPNLNYVLPPPGNRPRAIGLEDSESESSSSEDEEPSLEDLIFHPEFYEHVRDIDQRRRRKRSRKRGMSGVVLPKKIPSIECGECSICMDEVPLGTEIYPIPCRHIFHPTCLYPWIKRNRIKRNKLSCPNCREAVA